MDGLPARHDVPVAPELEHGPGLVASAWRRRWLIAALTLLGIIAGLVVAALQPTLYQGVARVLPPPDLTIQEGLAVDPARTLQNQAAIMSSTPVLTEVARRFGDTDTATLRDRVEVVASQEADVLTVTALDPTPEGAARLANAVVQAYQETVAGSSRQDAESRVTGLREQRERLGDRLNEIRSDLRSDRNDPALLTERQAIEAQYQSLVTQEYQLLAAAAQAGLTGLVEPAEVPRRPERPRPLLLAAGGGLAALAFSVALAWWLGLVALRRGDHQRPTTRRRVALPLGVGALISAAAARSRTAEADADEEDWSARTDPDRATAWRPDESGWSEAATASHAAAPPEAAEAEEAEEADVEERDWAEPEDEATEAPAGHWAGTAHAHAPDLAGGDWSETEEEEPDEASEVDGVDVVYDEELEPEDAEPHAEVEDAELVVDGELDEDDLDEDVELVDEAEIEDAEFEDAEDTEDAEDGEDEEYEARGREELDAEEAEQRLAASDHSGPVVAAGWSPGAGVSGASVPRNGTDAVPGDAADDDRARSQEVLDPTSELPEVPDEIDPVLLMEMTGDDPWAAVPAKRAAALPAADTGQADPAWVVDGASEDDLDDQDDQDDDWDDWDDWEDTTGDVIGGPTGDPTGDLLGRNGSAWSAAVDSTGSVPEAEERAAGATATPGAPATLDGAAANGAPDDTGPWTPGDDDEDEDADQDEHQALRAAALDGDDERDTGPAAGPEHVATAGASVRAEPGDQPGIQPADRDADEDGGDGGDGDDERADMPTWLAAEGTDPRRRDDRRT